MAGEDEGAELGEPAVSRSLCKSCKATVIWVTTEDGKAMPVDAAPVRNGNIRLEGSAARPTAVYVQPLLETPEHEAMPHYVSHFATCPDAQVHRKARR